VDRNGKSAVAPIRRWISEVMAPQLVAFSDHPEKPPFPRLRRWEAVAGPGFLPCT
jgi:hypothetical protein